jgi:hypothetical protein
MNECEGVGSEVNATLQVRFPRPIDCTSDPAPLGELVSESGLEELGAVSIGRSVLVLFTTYLMTIYFNLNLPVATQRSHS